MYISKVVNTLQTCKMGAQNKSKNVNRMLHSQFQNNGKFWLNYVQTMILKSVTSMWDIVAVFHPTVITCRTSACYDKEYL